MNSLGLFLKKKSHGRQRYKKIVYQHAIKDLRRRFVMLAAIIVIHSIAMVFFEDLNWWQAFWLTMTSASTTGYGDISAATFWGQLTTIVLIYGLGITLLAQIASDYVELRLIQRDMRVKGKMEWSTMRDHLLIINTPALHTERYLKLLITQISNTPELEDTPIQILTPHFPDGLPEELREMGVVHHTGDATEPGKLESAGVDKAKYIIVLSPDSQNDHSDSIVFDTLHRVHETGASAFLLAEAVNDLNRDRFRKAGANAVIRPIRAYPEMLVRSLIAPGTEQVLENLFRYQGDHTVRIDVNLSNVTWAEIVTRLIQENIGTALGYENEFGNIVTHPDTHASITARSLIVLVGDDTNLPSGSKIKALF
ncbi:potassium channel protein [Marinomonas mediterranea]|jgi:K+ transport systems, NAD-binding component|uniref:Ion transport 2 domain protein n=1 Tax=Marinomonas mediterranea (strain ATCC 700492 / JCM 21426 / NBRC 103028 / MMB-1) TaxID=717774 RepID=F2JW16_MARM1|nr:potassium channel protein [Marinomonas mediterranea]ADZ92904.1 Ion transport 2 domain protein [Marinomonas mediterranea MMB-1]WCN18927.1 metal transporter [Marinomonas mediterranea MMB-1]